MKVVKKDGRIQDFDLNKIKTSVMRASDDINQPMNSSDVNTIADRVEQKLLSLENENIKYGQIHDIVVGKLGEDGFTDVSTAYDQK